MTEPYLLAVATIPDEDREWWLNHGRREWDAQIESDVERAFGGVDLSIRRVEACEIGELANMHNWMRVQSREQLDDVPCGYVPVFYVD